MAIESKKGACSSHTEKAKANCLQHARRDYNEGKMPSYINPHLTKDNWTVFEADVIKNRKSLFPLMKRAEIEYTEKTGQKCQAKFAPFREAVLHLNGDVTKDIPENREKMMKFVHDVEQLTGWKVIGMWVHNDEGHEKSKYIEDMEGFELNYHVHVDFDCIDHTTGKAIRSGRDKLSAMQDLLAAATGMERGNYAWQTGRKHRKSNEERAFRQEKRAKMMDAILVEKQSKLDKLDKDIILAYMQFVDTDKQLTSKRNELQNLDVSKNSLNNDIDILEKKCLNIQTVIAELEQSQETESENLSAKMAELKELQSNIEVKNSELQSVNDYIQDKKEEEKLILKHKSEEISNVQNILKEKETLQAGIKELASEVNVSEEDLKVLTLDEYKFYKNDNLQKALTLDDLKEEVEKNIEKEIATDRRPFQGLDEWREERLKAIRKILRRLVSDLKAVGNLQKDSIDNVKKNMYKDAKQKAVNAVLIKQENERLSAENKSLDKNAVAREKAKTAKVIGERDAEKKRADIAEQKLKNINIYGLTEENSTLKKRLDKLKNNVLNLFPGFQNAIKAIIERFNSEQSRFTQEQKDKIDFVMSRIGSVEDKKNFGKCMTNVAKVLLEDTEEWNFIPKEIEQIAEGTWKPFNEKLWQTAVNAIVKRTEDPRAQHFTWLQYDAIMEYINDSNKTKEEAVEELWNEAKEKIKVPDAWISQTLSDLNMICNGEEVGISGGRGIS